MMALLLMQEQREEMIKRLPGSIVQYRDRLIEAGTSPELADRLAVNYQVMALACVYDLQISLGDKP